MGCCEVRRSSDTVCGKIQMGIEGNDVKMIVGCCKKALNFCVLEIIEQPYVDVRTLRVNSLGYSIFLGRFECFKVLIENFGCSLEKCNQILLSQNTSICFASDDLLMMKLKICEKRANTLTPIQVAVEKGNLGIIEEIFLAFQKNPPYIFDWNVQDPNTGENCALIACKKNNLPIIKYLHKRLDANFFVRNNSGESVLQVLAASSAKHKESDILRVFQYLIEEIGVNLEEDYEEILLLVEDEGVVKYFEGQLRFRGIFASKCEIEARFRIDGHEGVKSLMETVDPFFGNSKNLSHS